MFDISGLPPAHLALRELPAILTDRSAVNILASLSRMADRLCVAIAFAIPIGLMMGRTAVAAFFNPLLMIIYPVPKAALMPFIMLWLGVGDASKMLVIFLGVSLPVIYHAIRARALWKKRCSGPPPPWACGAARGCFASCCRRRAGDLVGCRTGLVLALITMVTSEMIARKQASATSCSTRSRWRSTKRSTP